MNSTIFQECDIRDVADIHNELLPHTLSSIGDDKIAELKVVSASAISTAALSDELETFGMLLKYGPIAERIYDLMNYLLPVMHTRNTKSFIRQVKKFVRDVPESLFLNVMRECVLLFLTHQEKCIEQLACLYCIISDFYGKGTIRCYNAESGEIVRVSVMDGVPVSAIDLYVVGSIVSIMRQRRNVQNMMDSVVKDVKKYYGRNYSKLALEDSVYLVFHNAFADYGWMLLLNTLFNSTLLVGNFLRCMLGYNKSTRYSAYKICEKNVIELLISKLNPQIFTQRNCYVRTSGVLLHLMRVYGGSKWEYVYLSETHTDVVHSLYVYVVGDDDELEFFVNIAAITGVLSVCVTEDARRLLLGILVWYGLKDELITAMNNAVQAFSTEEEKQTAKEYMSSLLNTVSEFFSEENIHYEDPTSWNYTRKGINYTSVCNNHKPVALFERKIVIDSFTRRLAPGQKASEEAKAAAAKVLLDLGNDKTFVQSFVRGQVYTTGEKAAHVEKKVNTDDKYIVIETMEQLIKKYKLVQSHVQFDLNISETGDFRVWGKYLKLTIPPNDVRAYVYRKGAVDLLLILTPDETRADAFYYNSVERKVSTRSFMVAQH